MVKSMIHVRACKEFDPSWEVNQVVQKAKLAKSIVPAHKPAKLYEHGDLSEGLCTSKKPDA